MDRCALFVDAGYLLADGAMAVHGTRHREAVAWDYPGLLQLLSTLSRERTDLPLLRCYWYEATVEGRRTPEHDALADIPGLKLRLARIRPGRREGVDAQVHRDLMTLARNNAICDAVVVSGDEDLAQVVSDAQDLGIRVTVIHIAADGSWAVSRTLQQECDDLIEIGSGHLRPYVNLVTGNITGGADLGSTSVNGQHLPQPLSNGRPMENGHAQSNGHQPSSSGTAQTAGSGASASSSLGSGSHGSGSHGSSAFGTGSHSSGSHGSLGSGTQGQGSAGPSQEVATSQGPSGLTSGQGPSGLASGQGPSGLTSGSHGSPPGSSPLGASSTGSTSFGLGSHGSLSPGDDSPPSAAQGSAAHGSGSMEPSAPATGSWSATGSQGSGLSSQGAGPNSHGSNPGSQGFDSQGSGSYGSGSHGSGSHGSGSHDSQGSYGSGSHDSQGSYGSGSHATGSRGSGSHGSGSHGSGSRGVAPPSTPRSAQPALPAAYSGYAAEPQQPSHSPPQPPPQAPPSPPMAAPVPSQPPAVPSQYNMGSSGGPPTYPGPQLGPYTGPQPAPVPSHTATPGTTTLADAVKAAHKEGHDFGESVARDAPALWLEAVLARKPRMPSDLEARLLQGSSLPIDFLLHDEVRHALRRGFWDALERARR
ncbi:NYN domain-containing protein [Sphaerisporangium sp. NBC_01403]|uniref:NYN domain-containing protein n=1 Tax=Sphaerisporangium sp. NBC_01403 TaxID=2903599 RepID=UPI0032513838